MSQLPNDLASPESLVHRGGVGMTHPAVNFVAYQLGWFACVLGGAKGHPWLGAAVAMTLAGLHLVAVPDWRREAVLIGTAGLTGLVADSLLLNGKLLTYASPWAGGASIAPIWIVALWAQFATTLRHSMRWLLGRPVLAAGLGAVFGPLAFRGGEALGGVRFAPNRLATLAALAAVWAVALPFLTHRAGRTVASAATE